MDSNDDLETESITVDLWKCLTALDVAIEEMTEARDRLRRRLASAVSTET